MSPVSPKIASPKFSAQVTECYFGDLAAALDNRLTTPVVFADRRICLLVVVEVGTMESGLRPGREPAERRLLHTCPLVRTSGPKSWLRVSWGCLLPHPGFPKMEALVRSRIIKQESSV